MGRSIIKNKEVFECYVVSSGKYDFWGYEKGIMYRVIEVGEKEIEGIKLKDKVGKIGGRNLGREIRMGVWEIVKEEEEKE